MSDVVLEAWQGMAPPRHGRARRGRARGFVLKALAGAALVAGTIALGAVALRMLPAPAPAGPTAPPTPPPPWREILKPVQIYSLQAASFAGAPATYTARVHAPGGGREDDLIFGVFDGDKPALRLRIFRRGAEAPSRTTLPDAMTSEATAAGLDLVGVGQPDGVPTRLGRFEVADVGVRRPNGAERSCAGFRLALHQPAMSIIGLACGGRNRPMSRTDVSCLLERLDVASARDDRELIDFFAVSELRRNAACAGMRLGPDGLHAPWLDEKPVPLKSKSEIASGKPATGHRSLRRH